MLKKYVRKSVEAYALEFTQEIYDKLLLVPQEKHINPMSVTLDELPDVQAWWNWSLKRLYIHTFNGDQPVNVGDYIVKELHNEHLGYYVAFPDLFNYAFKKPETYKPKEGCTIFKVVFDENTHDFCQAANIHELITGYEEETGNAKDIVEVIPITKEEAELIMLRNTDYEEGSDMPEQFSLASQAGLSGFCILGSTEWV